MDNSLGFQKNKLSLYSVVHWMSTTFRDGDNDKKSVFELMFDKPFISLVKINTYRKTSWFWKNTARSETSRNDLLARSFTSEKTKTPSLFYFTLAKGRVTVICDAKHSNFFVMIRILFSNCPQEWVHCVSRDRPIHSNRSCVEASRT